MYVVVFIALLCLMNFQLINSFLDAQCLTHLYIWLHLIHPLLEEKKKSGYCLPIRLAFYSHNIYTVSKSNQFKFTFKTVTRFSWKSNLKTQTNNSISLTHTHTVAQGHHLANLTMLLPWSWRTVLWAQMVSGCSKGLDKVCGKVRAVPSGPNDHSLSQLITEAILLLSLSPGTPRSRSLTFVL